MINVPLHADVTCKDHTVGQSTAVIVDPETLHVTHFVVKEKQRPHAERLVPVDQVVESTHDRIQLSCSLDELAAMEPFVTTEYKTVDMPRSSGYATTPYYSQETLKLEREHIPAGMQAVREGARVETTDGSIGHVDELLVDPSTDRITHFVLREGHLWGKKDVIVPVSVVDYADKDGVYLKLNTQTINSLLAIPTRQRRGAAEIELLMLTLDDAETADDALSVLKSLVKDPDKVVLNAAVLTKESDGKTSAKEIEDVDRRHGALFGAITGGLIGLVGGPAGVLLGAAAGAATGGAAAGWIDMGFTEEYLETLQEHLEPGKSAVVALVESAQVDKVTEALAGFQGQILRQPLTDEMLTQLTSEEDKD